ncbi:MAG TPA: hypothetical protein VHT73_18845 [Thermodesulfobacteriota bacterium]|nr:hypothetical protein [Thermodesulfobacteriota bacterium]
MHKQSAIVDLEVKLDENLKETVRSFLEALEYVQTLYHLQNAGRSFLSLGHTIFKRIIEILKRGASYLPNEEGSDLETKIEAMAQGIYDLYPLTLKRGGEDYIDLIIGKIFSWDKGNRGFYSGAVGVVNKNFDYLIKSYDKKLDLFLDNLPVPEKYKGFPIKESAPIMRCVDVFSLAGELNIRHKPICVFFSGASPENLSTLSRMTVFINIYTHRFSLISKKIAEKYLEDYSVIKHLDDETISKFLLLWLRGHDVGHFYGMDSLEKKISETDRSYMILHELKSDMVALYNLRYLTDELLKDDLLVKAYFVAIVEMFRYIRRGSFYNYPDTASAFLAYGYFREKGSIRYDSETKRFKVDFSKLETDIKNLTEKLLEIFAEGDVNEALRLVNRWGDIKKVGRYCLPDELAMLEDTDIPHYIDFNFVTRDRILGDLE